MTGPLYRRVVLKISGESLGGSSHLDDSKFAALIHEIQAVIELGVGVIVVVGGGNIYRGVERTRFGIPPADSDLLGMIATGLNAMMLRSMCDVRGIRTALYTRGPCRGMAPEWEYHCAERSLQDGCIVILAGGMGEPGFSTDVPAIHAAMEFSADAVLMAKNGVSGVYEADPKHHPDAKPIPSIAASEALSRRLAVMDAAALQLAIDYGVTIHVVGAATPNACRDVLLGRTVGSVVVPR